MSVENGSSLPLEREMQEFALFKKRGAKKVSFKDKDRKRRRAETREFVRLGVEELNGDGIVDDYEW